MVTTALRDSSSKSSHIYTRILDLNRQFIYWDQCKRTLIYVSWKASIRIVWGDTDMICGWSETTYIHTVLKVRLPTENLQVKLFGILKVKLLDGLTSTTYILLLLFIITRSNLSFNSFNLTRYQKINSI